MISHNLFVYAVLHKIRIIFVCFQGDLNFCNSSNGVGKYWWYFTYDDWTGWVLIFGLCTIDVSKSGGLFIFGKYGVDEGPDTLGRLNLLDSFFGLRWPVIMDVWMVKYNQVPECICSNSVIVHSFVWFCLITEQVWWCIGLFNFLTLGSFDDPHIFKLLIDYCTIILGRFKGKMHSFPTLRFFPSGFTFGRFLRRHLLLNMLHWHSSWLLVIWLL